MTYKIYFKTYKKSQNLLALHEAAWLLSQGLTVKKDLDKAITLCKELVNRETPFKLAYYLLANCYNENKQYDLAIKNYNLFIKNFGTIQNKNKYVNELISSSNLLIAQCLEKINKFNDAIFIYSKIINNDNIKNNKKKAYDRVCEIKKLQKEFGICIN